MSAWQLVLLGSGTVLVDRAAKALALRSLAWPDGVGRTKAVFRLVLNERPVFAQAGNRRVLIAVWALAVACSLPVLVVPSALASHAFGGRGIAVALAGAASNMRDQITRGAVVDFIAIGSWPAFNLADVAIIAGAAVAVGSVI